MDEILDKMRKIPSFSQCSDKTLKAILDENLIKNFSKGEQVFCDKEKLQYLYFAIEGHFSIYKLNNLGEKKVSFVLGQGSLLNDSVGGNLPSSIHCEAFSDGEVLMLPKKLIRELMLEDEGLLFALMEELEEKIRRLYRQSKNISSAIRMDKKLAAKLWKLSKDYGKTCDKGICIELELSHAYLADLLGTTRETLSRQMKVLSEQGLVIQEGKHIYIPSRDDLNGYFKGL